MTKNLATSLSASNPSVGNLSIVVTAGEGTRFDAANVSYATVHPAQEVPTIANSEIVKITGVTADTLTVERAQRGTMAKDIRTGWRISESIYVEDIDALKSGIASNQTAIATKGQVNAIVAGANVSVNNSDPKNPIISSTSTAVPAATFTANGTVKRREFNVRDYGALGNGTTDDTAAIQAAFNAASANPNGGTVYFPAGIYLQGKVIFMGNTNMKGEGRSKSVLQAKDNMTSDLYITQNFASEHNTNYTSYTTMSYNTVEDLTFQGGNQPVRSSLTDKSAYYYLLKYYGWIPYFNNIEFNGFEGALYTEYSNNQPHDPFENYAISDGSFHNINAKNYSKAGWTFRGPHDSDITNIRLFGGDYDTPDYDFMADNNGNFGGQGSYVHDLHLRSSPVAGGFNAIIRVSLNGHIYTEGGRSGTTLIETGGCNLQILTGFSDGRNDQTGDAAVVLRANTSGQKTNNNTVEVVGFYGPVNGDLVRLDASNGGQVNNNKVTTKINEGTGVTGAEFKLVGDVGQNILIAGTGQASTVFDLSAYTGGNNTFLTEGHKYRGSGYNYYVTAFIGNYNANADHVNVWLDAYPDYERLHIFNLPDSNDGAVTFNGGTRLKYVNALLSYRMAGYTIIAANDAPTAWKEAAQFTCDGTADNVEINSVLATMYTGEVGGKILLSPGTFNLASSLIGYGNSTVTTPTVTIEGTGMHTTFLKPASGVHAISVGKSTQLNVLSVCCLLSGASDGIHDIDGLTTSDGIGWRMRDNQIENFMFSGDSTHTGWGMQIQPFRMRMINIHGQVAKGSSTYTYPANGIRLFTASTPNTTASFNNGDSIMKRVHISVGSNGGRGLWIDTPDLATGDGSYFNQMTFEQVVLRNASFNGTGTAVQIGHAGGTKVRSLIFTGINWEDFNIGFDLYNAQDIELRSFFNDVDGSNAIFWRADSLSKNNRWLSAGTIGVYAKTQNVIVDANTDTVNPNVYRNLNVETVTGGSAQINSSVTTALPDGVVVTHSRGLQNGGARHPAFNNSFNVLSGGTP